MCFAKGETLGVLKVVALASKESALALKYNPNAQISKVIITLQRSLSCADEGESAVETLLAVLVMFLNFLLS